MDVVEAIKSRRAVRSYLPRPVSPEVVENLVELASLAPSSRNLQPWSFWIYLDPKKIEEMAQEIKHWLFNIPHAEPFTSPLRKILADPAYDVFYHAPVLILVAATSNEHQAQEDCCLAIENLLLAARAAELGSCVIGTARPWFNLPATKQSLNIPASYEVVEPIVIGYPSAWPDAPERRPVEDHWCALPPR